MNNPDIKTNPIKTPTKIDRKNAEEYWKKYREACVVVHAWPDLRWDELAQQHQDAIAMSLRDWLEERMNFSKAILKALDD